MRKEDTLYYSFYLVNWLPLKVRKTRINTALATVIRHSFCGTCGTIKFSLIVGSDMLDIRTCRMRDGLQLYGVVSRVMVRWDIQVVNQFTQHASKRLQKPI